VGAAIGAWCTVNKGWDPLVAMVAAAVVGAVVAVLVGLPALRLRGLYLAVTTLALSLAASEWVFSNRAWRWIPIDPFDRPLLLGRVSIDSPLRIYYLGLAVLAVVAWLLRGLRRSRTGRVLVALRDNETNVAAFGVSPTRAIRPSARSTRGNPSGSGSTHRSCAPIWRRNARAARFAPKRTCVPLS
jgi:branched-chain amino acid transport system permease protein